MDPITLVLLPGLDGTGTLFSPLIDALPENISTISVSYQDTSAQSYEDYRDYVITHLPTDTTFFILGESFSGPVALLVGMLSPERCLGIILSCTFASSVTPNFLPGKSTVTKVPLSAVPVSAIRIALTNSFKQTNISRSLEMVLKSLDSDVVSKRLQLILDLDIRSKLSSIDLPVLVLRASQDKLVGIRSSQEIVDLLPNAEEDVIRGPHLLLQTEPDICADSIERFIEKVRAA